MAIHTTISVGVFYDIQRSMQVNLKTILKYCENKSYMVNGRKECSFAQNQIEYLGHIVSEAVVLVELPNIVDIIDRPILMSMKELWGFMRLIVLHSQKFVTG